MTTTFFWAFNEGFFIVRTVVLDVFAVNTRLYEYFLIGWGAPLAITILWLLAMLLVDTSDLDACWAGYARMNVAWIFLAPMIGTLIANVVVIVVVVWLLVTKLKAQNATEREQLSRALKSILVLVPLLGVTHLIFPFKFKGTKQEIIYRVFNAVNHNIQGIAVGIMYCFMNKQVQLHVCRKWKSWRHLKSERKRFAKKLEDGQPPERKCLASNELDCIELQIDTCKDSRRSRKSSIPTVSSFIRTKKSSSLPHLGDLLQSRGQHMAALEHIRWKPSASDGAATEASGVRRLADGVEVESSGTERGSGRIEETAETRREEERHRLTAPRSRDLERLNFPQRQSGSPGNGDWQQRPVDRSQRQEARGVQRGILRTTKRDFRRSDEVRIVDGTNSSGDFKSVVTKKTEL